MDLCGNRPLQNDLVNTFCAIDIHPRFVFRSGETRVQVEGFEIFESEPEARFWSVTFELFGFHSTADWGTQEHLKRFRGGLVLEVNRLLHHSTLGLRVIEEKKTSTRDARPTPPQPIPHPQPSHLLIYYFQA